MGVRKNKSLNTFPRFIWGEAVTESGFDDQEYLVHTRYPRFICKVYEGDGIVSWPQDFQSRVGTDPETEELIYETNLDLSFKDWVWLDKGGSPLLDEIRQACDAAVLNYMIRDDEYGINKE